MKDIELKTESGYIIKIKSSENKCIVFLGDNAPEVIKGGRMHTMEQPIPCMLFIGKKFKMVLIVDEYVLVRNRKNKLRVPYKFNGNPEIKNISLSCYSRSDQFPIKISHYEGVKQFISRGGAKHSFRYMVLDNEVSRIEVLNLRVKNPDVQIIVIRSGDYESSTEEIQADDKKNENVRATDVIKTEQGKELAKNPVFLARIHLRNLELGRVLILLKEYKMSSEEIQFIRTFLDIMVKNEQKKPDLKRVGYELMRVNEIYRLCGLLESEDNLQFDKELETGIEPDLAREMESLVALYRKRGRISKEKDIQFWEWEYRLKKIVKPEEKEP